MARVIGVRFRTAGKIYFFSPGKFDVKRGNQVIVETARGIEFGNVVTGPKDVPDDQIMQPLKTVVRIATEEDRRTEEKNREKVEDRSVVTPTCQSLHRYRSRWRKSRICL